MTQKNLFKRGESIFHTPVIGTTDLPPQDVIARINWSNTPERLNTFFFGPEVLKLFRIIDNNVELIKPSKSNWNLIKKEYVQKKKEIYLVSVKKPTSGYSETALLAVAGKVSQLVGKSKKNDLIYDYPETVRVAYWKTVLGVMEKFVLLQKSGNLPGKFSKLKPILMGHHGRELSNYPPFENNPGIRTVILHHDHLVFLDESRIKPLNWNDSMFNLDKEAALFLNTKTPNLSELVNEIDARLNKVNSDLKISLRRKRPYGYEVEIDYGGKSSVMFTKFLQKHFFVYSDLTNKSGILLKSHPVQPAFTFYLIPESAKKALIIFSPNLVSKDNFVPGGPERAGMLIRRSPDVAPTMTENEKVEFSKMLVK